MAMYPCLSLPSLSFPSVSGAICTFNSQYAGLPLKSHTVALTATQSGSGTPSPDNVRPISGWDELHICNTSKNLLKADKFQYNTSNIFLGCTDLSTPNYVFLKAGTYTITVNGNASVQASKINYGNANNTWILNDNPATITITTPTFYRFWISRIGGTVSVGDIDNFQLEFGNEPTTYEPYNNNSQTITIQIGSTVYGGEYDARTGVLTVTHILVSITVMQRATSGTFFYDITDGIASSNMLCNMAELGAIVTSHTQAPSYPKQVCLQQQSASNLRVLYYNADYIYEDWNAFIANNPFVVCVECQPTTIQLPPCPIDTLEGVNNIWADTGDTTLQYAKFG